MEWPTAPCACGDQRRHAPTGERTICTRTCATLGAGQRRQATVPVTAPSESVSRRASALSSARAFCGADAAALAARAARQAAPAAALFLLVVLIRVHHVSNRIGRERQARGPRHLVVLAAFANWGDERAAHHEVGRGATGEVDDGRRDARDRGRANADGETLGGDGNDGEHFLEGLTTRGRGRESAESAQSDLASGCAGAPLPRKAEKIAGTHTTGVDPASRWPRAARSSDRTG